jgi:hypothetical protein
MQSKHQRTRVHILVKAFPQHSQKYEETVCCAGITDAGQLIRLFPITYRRLSPENRFDRFDQALKMLEQEYGTRIPTRHPHFIMGTMKLHPRNFILIGLLRTGLDPDELAKQGSLF